MIVYAAERRWPPDKARATLQLFFLFAGAFAVIGFSATGIITARTLRWNAVLFPFLLIGGWAGQVLGGRLRPEAFRRLILLCLLGTGLFYLARFAPG